MQLLQYTVLGVAIVCAVETQSLGGFVRSSNKSLQFFHVINSTRKEDIRHEFPTAISVI